MAAGSAIGGRLGDFFVELSARGAKDTKDAIDQIGYALQAGEDKSQGMAAAFAEAFEKGGAAAAVATRGTEAAGKATDALAGKATALRRSLEETGKITERLKSAFTATFVAGTAVITGFVMAGMAGTVEGNRLRFMIEQLGAELSAVFLPVIRQVIDWLTETVVWFRKLTDGQRDLILALAGTAVGIGLVGKALMMLYANPMLAGFLALVGVIALVGKAMVEARGEADRFRASMEAMRSGKLNADQIKDAFSAAGIEAGDTPQEKARKARERIKELDEVAEKHGLDISDTTRAGKGFFEDPRWAEQRKAMARERAALRAVAEAGERGEDLSPAETEQMRRRRLTRASPGFEGVGDAYRRIQTWIARHDTPEVSAIKTLTAEQKKAVALLEGLKQLAALILPRLLPAA